ncbi:MAG: hypothetical protein HY037_03420, partial [Nitrospirae bacterium]|nr:hypothetical protein [Candidatus Troglogloeales bacterium]
MVAWLGAVVTTQKTKIVLSALALFLAIFAYYYAITFYLYKAGYIHLNLIFFAEKTLLALQGNPPRLENVGFVYPPFSFLFTLIFRDPVVTCAFVSSALTILLIFRMKEGLQYGPLFFMSATMLVVSPVFLFVASQKYDFFLQIVFLAFGMNYYLRYRHEGSTLHLFAAGFLYGMTFFIDFRSLYLLPAVAVVSLLGQHKNRSHKVGVTIVLITPMIFFFSAWIYLNWVFTQDPLNFIHSPYSFFQTVPQQTEVAVASFSLIKTVAYASQYLLIQLPILLPYLVSFFFLRTDKGFDTPLIYAVNLFPVLLTLATIYAGQFFPATFYGALFLVFLFVNFEFMKPSKIMTACMIVSLFASFFMPLYSLENNERNFLRALYGFHYEKNIVEFQNVAAVLQHTKGEILLDDANLFPVVYFTGDARRFLLPYNYGFYSALSNPARFGVQYAVV